MACRKAADSVEKLLLLLERTFGFSRITYLMAYCIYTATSAMIQDVKSGDIDAKAKMSTFLRALRIGVKSCPIVQRSIDIINNSLQSTSPELTSVNEHNGTDGHFRNYLPAFPYRDVRGDYANETHFGGMELDTFSLLDSFPENHIDNTVTTEWYWPNPA